MLLDEDEIAGASEKMILKYSPKWSGAGEHRQELERWDKEHRELLDKIAPEQFEILHYAAITVLRKI